jgi:lipopolysaccharide biosynthesis glycosyltransferase
VIRTRKARSAVIIMKDIIPIVLCTNYKYVPFMSVMMQSIMENAGKENLYSFFIFYKDINPPPPPESVNTDILQKQVEKFPQFSITFINVAEYFENRNLKVAGHLTVEMYFRLAAPYILTDYKKILYFDCDMVCRTDVRNLYEIDLGDNLAGVVSQLNAFQYINKELPSGIAALNLKYPYKYFNSGMLLMNAEQFRKTVKLEYMIEKAIESQMFDQDLLNYICDGKTLCLSYAWNFVIDYTYTRLPKPLKEQYLKYAKNPFIIHFQPWTHIIPTLFSNYFWDYASRTSFCDEIKQIKRKNFSRNIKKYFRHAAGYFNFGGLKPLFAIFKDMLQSGKKSL